MAAEGSPNLAVREFILDPNRPFADIDQIFHSTEGYVGLRLIRLPASQDNGPARHGLVYTFRTTTDAMTAMANHPTVNIGVTAYLLEPYYGNFGESQTDLGLTPSDQPIPDASDISPPRKRLKKEPPAEAKLTCKICFNELEGPYSTPCRRCKALTCYECLASQFRVAMKNIDRMPVTCCGSVMHHDVAKGVLPTAELEEYKLKYDERMNAVDPLYCPVPTCSTFIPPRMFNQNDTKIACHVCSTVVCTKCKQLAEGDHSCAEDDPRKLILETFHYKLCPRCGAGVMRMHGCPHLRCQCGAHWCWDCQRPMNACYQKPCRAARDEGNHSDGDNGDAESDDENAANVPVVDNALVTGGPQTTITHSEVEQDVADTLVALREGPVVHIVPADSLVVDAGDNAISSDTTPPVVARGPGTTPVAAQTGTIESGINEQVPTLAHSDADMTTLEVGAPIVEQSEPTTHNTTTMFPAVGADALDSNDTAQEAVLTELVTDLIPISNDIAIELPGTQSAPLDPTVANAESTTIAPEPTADTTAPVASVTEQPANQVENLDDPDEFDWEGRDMDFGDEPTDETWDVWGCRHHFYDLSKDRIPQFWLVGVHPATDSTLEIECMGCFKKTKAWDDDAELEAFRIKYGNKDGVELGTEALKQKMAEWNALEADATVNGEPAGSVTNDSKKPSSKNAVECRHGCGVVYCPSCKKASRRRIRKERVAVDN